MPLTAEQAADIEAQRAESAPTRRAVSPALEEILYEALPVLDHGFVRVVDYMGNDASVARAARVSYGRQDSDRGPDADAKLIRYLMRHRHTSPSEMARLVLHVRLPIFVARQWMRHRTWSFNEVSARYTTLPDDVYVPDLADICGPPTDNKQGRGRGLPTGEAQEAWWEMVTAADAADGTVGVLTAGVPRAGDDDSPFAGILAHSLITDAALVPDETKRALAPIIGKYLS